jgi:hypothetical protein
LRTSLRSMVAITGFITEGLKRVNHDEKPSGHSHLVCRASLIQLVARYTDTRQAGSFVRANLNWVSGRVYDFTLRYDGQGSGSYRVSRAGRELF